MPLQTYATFIRMTELCKATVPKHIQANLDAIKVRSIRDSWWFAHDYLARRPIGQRVWDQPRRVHDTEYPRGWRRQRCSLLHFEPREECTEDIRRIRMDAHVGTTGQSNHHCKSSCFSSNNAT